MQKVFLDQEVLSRMPNIKRKCYPSFLRTRISFLLQVQTFSNSLIMTEDKRWMYNSISGLESNYDNVIVSLAMGPCGNHNDNTYPCSMHIICL